MKLLNILLGVLFLAFAALQFNDPDPLYWIVVYAGAGLIALGRGIGRSSPFLDALVMGLALAGMLIAFPGVIDYLKSGQWGSIAGTMGSAGYVEPAREFVGLAMVAAVLAWYRLR